MNAGRGYFYGIDLAIRSFFRSRQPLKALLQCEFLSHFAIPMGPRELKQIEGGFVPPPSAARHVRILHLSDLHFGTKYARAKQDYVLSVVSDELAGRVDVKHVHDSDEVLIFALDWKRGLSNESL